ncbi:hypothetical protein H4F99_14345 [Lysobacter sp. SG-8]|uniref:Uncharacterized protein n=1 Tax=Marilutibacter penaei TaxID=2759900 RepID=A0A7W3YFV2_9GAMM|nr:hypothetical protein [Lysobacter penaei]
MQTLHFAALSLIGLDRIVSALESTYGLGPFDCDVEDSWEYATARLPSGTTLNITRTTDTSTIASWIPSAPSCVNWQIIVSSSSDLTDEDVSTARQALEHVLGTSLVPYHAA